MRLDFPGYTREPETKFLTSAGVLRRMLEDIDRSAPFVPEPVRRDERTNIYHDTPDFDLTAKHFECRSRRAGGTAYRYDLKTPDDPGNPAPPDENGISLRREYRQTKKSAKPDLSCFNKGSLKKYLEKDADKPLLPLVKGLFARRRFTFSPTGFPDSQLEIAFEEGSYETMDGIHRSKLFYIVELELKSGRMAALAATANRLCGRYGLEPCPKSKGQMGIEFASTFFDAETRKKFAAVRRSLAGPSP